MDFLVVAPNLIAMLASVVAVVSLGRVVPKLGGELGRMVKMLVIGIVLAVFVHAGLELAAALGLVAEDTLMVLMAGLLTVGSGFFAYAGHVGNRAVG